VDFFVLPLIVLLLLLFVLSLVLRHPYGICVGQTGTDGQCFPASHHFTLSPDSFKYYNYIVKPIYVHINGLHFDGTAGPQHVIKWGFLLHIFMVLIV